MAFSCVYAALPVFVPKAFAEGGSGAEAADWNALANAFRTAENAGYMSTNDWSSIISAEGTVTVTDETRNGYAYNVVRALAGVLEAEGKGKNNVQLRGYIASQLTAVASYTLNEFQTAFLTALLPADGNYGAYTPETLWNGSADDAEAFGALTMTLVATRSEEAAVLSDVENLSVVPETAETKVTVTITGSPVLTESDNGSETGMYYANSEITVEKETPALSDALTNHLTKLKAYIDYVSTAAFTEGYEEFYAYGTNGSIDALIARSTESLQTLVDEYLTSGLWADVITTDPTVDMSYIEEFLGSENLEKQHAYVAAANDALAVVAYRDYVLWIMQAIPVAGYRNRDDYTATDIGSLEAVRAATVALKGNMAGASADILAALNRVYGYTGEEFDAHIATLDALIYKYYLQEIATATEVLLNNNHNTVYTFSNEASRFFQAVAADELLATTYKKTSDTHVDQTKTYYKKDVASVSYVPTEDTAPVAGKTYYVLNADTNEYTAVASPSAENIATYYEKVVTYNYVQTTDKVIASGKTYYVADGGSYVAVASPTVEDLASYYEVKMVTVSTPSGAELGDYYEISRVYGGLKGIGDNDYVSADYDFSDEECPITDDDLLDLITFFTQATNYIAEARNAGVDISLYMTQAQVNAIDETVTALNAERTSRGRVTDQFLEDYLTLVEKMTGYGASGKSAATVMADIGNSSAPGTFEYLYNQLKTRYSWFANDIRGKKARAFIDSLYVELFDRAAASIRRIVDDYELNGSVVDIRNVYAIRTDASHISTELINFLNGTVATGILTAAGKNMSLLNTASVAASDSRTAAWIISQANSWSTSNLYNTVFDNQTNYLRKEGGNTYKYITRKGVDADFARSTAPKDYFTAYTGTAPNVQGNKASIESTITKLDTFLSGQQMTQLLGADDRGLGITTLNEYIKLVLVENLFTDEIVNKLLAALFPMLTDLFEKTIPKVLEEKVNNNGAGLNLSTLPQDYVEGTLKIWYNGGVSQEGHGTVTFANMLNQLEVKIYPQYFGPYLTSKGYTAAGNAIQTANAGWTKFRASSATDADGNWVDPVVFDFDWGIDSITGTDVSAVAAARFARFKTVLGDIFGAALPLLRALFTSADFYQSSVHDFAAVRAHLTGSGKWYLSEFFWFGMTHDIEGYDLDIQLRVRALDLYRTLWIPIMEALGINGDLMSYSFPALSSSCTGAQLVGALFDPLYALIGQVADHPVESVAKLLPNLSYHLMAGSVNGLLDRHVVLYVKGNDLTFDGTDITTTIIQWAGNAFSQSIAGAIEVNEAISLSDFLVLEDILGFSLTDINSVLQGVVGMIKEGATLSLPGINTGKLATMYNSISKTYASSAYTVSYNADDKVESFTSKNGKRTYVTANTAVVFFSVFDYLFRAVQQPGVLAEILGFVAELSGSEISLPEIVFTLLGGIESSQQAFAALIELLNEPEYDLAEFDWFQSNDEDRQYTFSDTAPLAYTQYNNDWTVEKAQYLYDNVDNIVNAVMNMIDSSVLEGFGSDANVWLQAFINQMFDNEGIMNVIEIVTAIGNALAAVPGVSKILRQQIKGEAGTADADIDLNLLDWYNKFGYIYEDYQVEPDESGHQFLAYNAIEKQTYLYELTVKEGTADINMNTQTANVSLGASSGYSVSALRAYPVAPGQTIKWQKDGDVLKKISIVPYNQAYIQGLFPNLKATEAGTSENGDILYTWEIRKTAANAAYLPGDEAIGTWIPLVDLDANNLPSDPDEINRPRYVFTAIFCELIGPLAPLFSFILSGTDLHLFGTTSSNSLTIQGYPAYDYAILPMMEALGVHDMMTGAAYKNKVETEGSDSAFNELVKELFDTLTYLLTDERLKDDQGNLLYFKVDSNGDFIYEGGQLVPSTEEEGGKVFGKGAFQKVIDVLPHLFYFIQSDGITTILKNLPMFVWQLLDTLRPIVNLNLDEIIHVVLCRALGFVYDENDANYAIKSPITSVLLDLIGMKPATYSDQAAQRDAHKVQNIFDFSLKRLSLEDVYTLVEALTGLDLSPLTYALEGMSYQNVIQLAYVSSTTTGKPWKHTAYLPVERYNPSATNPQHNLYESYTLNFEGRDTITVTISALLDLLRYEEDTDGDGILNYKNAEALDALLGTARERLPGAQALIGDEADASGLIEAIVKVFKDVPYSDHVKRPNWDYVFENRTVPTKPNGDTFVWTDLDATGETQANSQNIYNEFTSKVQVADFHKLHYGYMYNLQYLTSWQPEHAQATVEMLEGLLDYVVGLVPLESLGLEGEITNFSDLVTALLDQKLFTNDTLQTLVGFLGKLYDVVPAEIIDIVDHLIGINLNKWIEDGILALGEDGKYVANPAYAWFVEGGTGYVDTKSEFLDALKTLIEPAANLLAVIFLSRDYRLFKHYDFTDPDGGIENGNYGDAVVLNAANAYAVGLVPILEAFGVDLTGYEPDSYYHPELTGDARYDSAKFVDDMLTIFDDLFDDILANPVTWLLNNLPNIIYFVNADGLSVSVENIFGSINQVLVALNTVIDLDFDLTNIMGSGLDLTKLTLEGVFGLIYKLTCDYKDNGDLLPGLRLSNELATYIKNLYIGEVKPFVSANGYQSYKMQYTSEEEKKDMVTVLLALVLQYATDTGSFIDTDNHGNLVEFNNAETLDRLLFKGQENEGLVGQILDALRNPKTLTRIEMNWDYFQEGYDLAAHTDDETMVVEVPAYAFQYLNYTTLWTYDKAKGAEDSFGDLVFQVLKMLVPETIDPESDTAELMTRIRDAETLGDILTVDAIYSGELLQKILDVVHKLLYGEDSVLNETLIKLIGVVLGGDLTQWDGRYAFVNEGTAEGTEAGMGYYMDGEVKKYIVNDKTSFVAGITKLLEPATGLLGWLLFGQDYTFFSSNTVEGEVLLTIRGSNGYRDGLALLLEALGVEGLGYVRDYQVTDPVNGRVSVDTSAFVHDLALGIANRAEAICADPVNEIVSLIPELIYFINAGGLQACVTGLLSGPLGLVNSVAALSDVVKDALGVDLPDETEGEITENDYAIVNQLLTTVLKGAITTDKLDDEGHPVLDENDEPVKVSKLPDDWTFTLDGVNLKFALELVEYITGLELTAPLGENLDKFFMGEIVSYASKSEAVAYKARFSRENVDETDYKHFADFITILLSGVIDILEYQVGNEYVNAIVIGDMIDGVDTALIVSIVGLLKSGFESNILPIDWLYFDDATSLYTLDSDGNVVLKPEGQRPTITEGSLTKPDATISYLTYASDWTEETANYVTDNLKTIVLGVLGMLNKDGSMDNIVGIVNGSLAIEDLYTADNLNAILKPIKKLIAGDPNDPNSNGLPDIVLQLLNIVLDIDLSAYNDMAEYTTITGTKEQKRQAFVAGLNEVLQPIAPILDWLLFGRDLTYFDKKTGNEISPLISINGADGYVEAIVPLLEALGVRMPACTEETTSADILYPLINNVLARVESIAADPINEVLDLLPNLIYFINTNALATIVNNLLAPVFALVNQLSPILFKDENDEPLQPVPTEEININDMVEKILGLVNENLDVEIPAAVSVILDNVNFTKLDLLAIFELVEAVLASEAVMEDKAVELRLIDVLTGEHGAKIEKFYTHLVYAESSTGRPAFKMVGSADMVTILVNYLLEVLLYENGDFSNADAIDTLAGTDMVTKIVNLIKGISNAPEIEIATPVWNYFDENVELGEITIPAREFVYLDYSNSWTFEKAVAIDGQLGGLLTDVLTMAGIENVSDFINGLLPLDTYLSADGLNTILGLLRQYLYGEDAIIDEVLLNVVGHVIGAEGISAWKGDYIFESEAAAGYAVVEDETYGLSYYTDEAAIKHYIVTNRTEFASGLQLLLEPANKLLGWLLLGNDIAFFVKNEDGNVDNYEDLARQNNELIRIAGTEGYSTGLVLLLEALGCQGLRKASEYNGNASALLKDIIVSVLNRLDAILANPIDELLALIPELLYFINAHGLQTVVQNFAGSVLNVLEKVNESGLLGNTEIDVEAMLSDLIKGLLGDNVDEDWTFTWDDVDLSWVIGLVEAVTDLEIEDAVGYAFKYFVIGVVERYDSATEYFVNEDTGLTETYKVRFATEDEHTANSRARMRADMITILLSLVIDVLEYGDNAAVIEAMINAEEEVIPPGTIAAVLDILQNAQLGDMKEIEWFYYFGDETFDFDAYLEAYQTALDNEEEPPEIPMPERTIHYIDYSSDWTEESADYVATHIEDILAEVFGLLGMEETTVAGLIASAFSIEDLYTAENLNKIVDAVKSLTSSLAPALIKVAGLILGGDFSAYNTMHFADEAITGRASFLEGLTQVLEPVYGLLNWLLFGEGFDYFYDNDYYHGGADERDLINLKGAEGYAYGLVPILEALGVQNLPDVTEETKLEAGSTFLYDVLNAVLTRVEQILDDPVNQIFAILPNILYFINANGLSVSVFNLLNAVLGLLDPVNEALEELGGIDIGENHIDHVDVNDLVNELLHSHEEGEEPIVPEDYNINIEKLDLIAVVELIEAITGLKIAEVVTAQKIDLFYLGQLEYFRSSNGKSAFRMVYSEDEGRAEMITIAVNFIVEVLLYEKDGERVNIEVLKEMLDLGEDTEALIDYVVDVLTGKVEVNANYTTPNWNYFDTTAELSDTIKVPERSFIYLAYKNDWTMARANGLDNVLADLVDNILAIVNGDADYTVADLIAENVDLDELVYNAKNLNSIMELIRKYLYGDDAFIGSHILEFAGLVLGGELSVWDSTWTFEAAEEGAEYVEEPETGLRYSIKDNAKVYAIAGADDFVNALLMVLKPAERLLSWLLLGRSYEFFVDAQTGEQRLIKVPGTNAYGKGLVYLLEALGVKGLKKGADYADMHELLDVVLHGIVNRVNEILADPINEVLDLIPELIYFINANGLGVVINNTTTVLFNIVDAIGIDKFSEDIPEGTTVKAYIEGFVRDMIRDALENDEITFSFDGVNLAWLVDLVEALTDFEIRPVIGETYALEKFALGTATKYDTKADLEPGQSAYKMFYTPYERGAERADLITIAISLAIDMLKYEPNRQALADILNGKTGDVTITAETIEAVLDLLSDSALNVEPDVDWFYFDPAYTYTPESNLTLLTPSINYLSYWSNWDEEFANYLDDHLGTLIAAVLNMIPATEGKTVSGLLKEALMTALDREGEEFDVNEVLYTADLLNTIKDAIAELTGKLDDVINDAVDGELQNNRIKEAIDVLLDVDISAWDTMTFGSEIHDRASFANGLAQIVAPIAPILDWLLFGDDLALFNKGHIDDAVIADIIVVNGYDGYAYGLIPLLEALGVQPDHVTIPEEGGTDPNYCTTALLPGIIEAVLERAEQILDDPVNQILALIPNVLYFINANGLASAVNHLLGAPLALVDGVNGVIEALGITLNLGGSEYTSIDVDQLVNGLLPAEWNVTIDTKELRLHDLIKIVEAISGLELDEFIEENKIEEFYLGQITAFESANGKTAFRMEYSDGNQGKDRADMITVLVNYLLEAALYGDNTAKLEGWLGIEEGTINAFIDALAHLGAGSFNYDWNYFGGEETRVGDELVGITTPETPFMNYITYRSDWTQTTANSLVDNLDDIINAVLKMVNADDETKQTVAGILNQSFNLYTAENLNKILELIQNLYEYVDDGLLETIDALLKTDLTYWDGLAYTDAQITDSGSFGSAVIEILTPVYSVLDWLFFGKALTLFVKDKQNHENLIVVQGSDAYGNGLAPILEALGVETPAVTADSTAAEIVPELVRAILARVDAILADPVDEAIALLPELIYFINANGLSDAVYNMFGGIINAANKVFEMGLIDSLGDYASVEELVFDKFAIDTKKLDLVGIFTFLENYETEDGLLLKGLKILEAFPTEGDKSVIENFYLGAPGTPLTVYTSANGNTAFKMELNENRGDMLTILLSFVLDVLLYEENEEPIVALLANFGVDLTVEDFHNLKAILVSGVKLGDDAIRNINWGYFAAMTPEELQAAIEGILSLKVDDLKPQPVRTIHYLEYDNNWSYELRDYLNENLESIVDAAVNMITQGQNVSLQELLETNVKVFSDDTANALMGYIANALSKVDDVLIDNVGALVGAENLSALKTKKASGITNKEQFVDFFVETLSPLSTVLDFLLFGKDFELFTHLTDTEVQRIEDESTVVEAAGDPAMIRIKGGEGYKNGLAPILGALGVDTDISEEKTEVALREVLTNLCDRIDQILYGGDTINEALLLLLNVIYFVDADGLSVSVHNLLAPIDALLAAVGAVIGKPGMSVNSLITAVDLENLNFDFVFELVYNKLGLVLSDEDGEPIGAYLKNFYFGALEPYTTYGGVPGFRMVYTEEENRIDMVTIVVTLLLDVITYKKDGEYGNREALVNLIMQAGMDEQKANNVFDTIIALLTDSAVTINMYDYNWRFTQYADTDTILSPASGLTAESIFGDSIYGPLYTREMGAYMQKYFSLLIDTYITLLGVDNGRGGTYRNLKQILNDLLGNTIYKTSTLQSVADAISGAMGSLVQTLKEAGLYTHVKEVLARSLGIDLEDLVNITVNPIQDGNKTQFINELCRILRPVSPILRWLLTGEDIAFFNNREGDDYLILHGAEGYQYAIIPILQALHVKDSEILNQTQYAALSDDDLLKVIITPILNRVDYILEDPMTRVFDELTGVVYFLYCDGLDTAFKNLLNPIYNLLTAIDPLIADVPQLHDNDGSVSLYKLIGIDGLKVADLNSLLNKLIDSINEDAPLDLTGVIGDAANELLLGKVKTLTQIRVPTAGNPKDYTMVYAPEGSGDEVDMVTLVLRLFLRFISEPQNVKAIEALLKGKLNEDGYKFLCALLENFGQMASTHDGMDKIMYTVYYIFYAALNAGVATNNGLAEFNGDYSFLNQLFATSNLGFMNQLEKSFGDLLNKWTPDVVDEDEVVPNGFIRFFKSIGDFFRRIIAWFQSLFK
ncbi:MAG: hypothetical protein IK104_01910 [Clostridia bacterium]|nr:hypothetical protein [Clostridia bacterium]